MVDALSADEARRLALAAQGLLGAADRRAGVTGVLQQVGAVQLDTISVLARSHELVPYARLGPVGRHAVEAAYWGSPPATFEYWSHAACILPLETWPWFEARRRVWRERIARSERISDETLASVRRALEDGPKTATELGGAKRGGIWWDWSDVKVAVEQLLWMGHVACVERRGWRRVYDLAERVVPAPLLAQAPTDHECAVALVAAAGARLGVATRADLADHHRLRLAQVDAALPDTGLVPVEVAGWGEPGWADPVALARPPRGRHRTTLLSPFDSLVWDRDRTERVFGFTHRLEAYVPKPKRVHGYFTMPLLAGGRLVGRVDPGREGRTLVARQVSVAGPRWLPALAAALTEAATWVGCDAVAVERMTPEHLRAPLEAALA